MMRKDEKDKNRGMRKHEVGEKKEERRRNTKEGRKKQQKRSEG